MRFIFYVILSIAFVFAGCSNENPGTKTDLEFSSNGTMIRGTLFSPSGQGPFPAVVLVHGAAPTSRKEYGEYVRELLLRDIAVFTYDKRGFGHSGGDMWVSGFRDLAFDAIYAAEKIGSTPNIDADRVGLMGFNQGGRVAEYADSLSAIPAFVVSISSPPVSPQEQSEYFVRQIVAAQSGSDEVAGRFNRFMEAYLSYVREPVNYPRVVELRDSIISQDDMRFLEDQFRLSDFEYITVPDSLPSWRNIRLNPSARDYFYNPFPQVERTETPHLFIFGGQDQINPIMLGAQRLEPLIQSGKVELKSYLEADHNMREEQRFPMGYFDDIARWIKNSKP